MGRKVFRGISAAFGLLFGLSFATNHSIASIKTVHEYIKLHNENAEESVERVEEEERQQRETQATEMRQRLFEKLKPNVEQLLEGRRSWMV